jgi:hypothetical protein
MRHALLALALLVAASACGSDNAVVPQGHDAGYDGAPPAYVPPAMVDPNYVTRDGGGATGAGGGTPWHGGIHRD